MTNWGLSGLGLYRKDDDDERLDDNHNDDDGDGDDGDDDEGDGKDNHVLALKGWMDPVAWYQALESQSLSATWNNISSHIIMSTLPKIAQKCQTQATSVQRYPRTHFDPMGPFGSK